MQSTFKRKKLPEHCPRERTIQIPIYRTLLRREIAGIFYYSRCESFVTMRMLCCDRKQKTKEVKTMTPERPPKEILEIIGDIIEWFGW